MPADICQFADFELDRNAYQLRRKGRPVRLERIPLDLLFILAETAGRLVTREEILERIWGKNVFIETDTSINAAVRKIRRVLHDDADAPRFVATVPTRGYRFIAPLARRIGQFCRAVMMPPDGLRRARWWDARGSSLNFAAASQMLRRDAGACS